jgi:hypothetical protein
MSPQTFACEELRLGTTAATRFCHAALLATEEDIAFSCEKTWRDDLSFFLRSFWSCGTFLLVLAPPPLASQALSATDLPVKKRFSPQHFLRHTMKGVSKEILITRVFHPHPLRHLLLGSE